jgi:cold shock CspA family protein
VRNDARESAEFQPLTVETRESGVVSRLIEGKGFGFIRADSGHEFFLHMSNCLGSTWAQLSPGVAVTFVPTMTAKGSRAVLVKLKENRESER